METFIAERDAANSTLATITNERDGYKSAMEAFIVERDAANTALATITSERDGYKNAMETFIAERDAANSALSTITAERDGYRSAYEAHSRELGSLRVTAAPVIRTKERQDAGAGRRSIFLVTLPKSGTVYVSHALAQSLDYDHTGTLATPTFPKNILWGEMLADFAKGGMIRRRTCSRMNTISRRWPPTLFARWCCTSAIPVLH